MQMHPPQVFLINAWFNFTTISETACVNATYSFVVVRWNLLYSVGFIFLVYCPKRENPQRKSSDWLPLMPKFFERSIWDHFSIIALPRGHWNYWCVICLDIQFLSPMLPRPTHVNKNNSGHKRMGFVHAVKAKCHMERMNHWHRPMQDVFWALTYHCTAQLCIICLRFNSQDT